MPGRYVPILHQRPPEQEPRERPPCSVRNNRVSSTCPEFHGNDLFEHTYTYTRCAPSVFQLTYFADKKESSLNNPTDSQVLRDLKKKNHMFDNFQRATHFIIPLKKYVSNFSRPKRLLSDFTSLENTSPRKGDNLLSRYRHVRVNIS